MQTVLLVSRWPMTVNAELFDNGLGGKEHGKRVVVGDAGRRELSDEERIDYFTSALRKTILDLKQANKRVVVMFNWPEIGWNVPNYALHDLRFSRPRQPRLAPPRLPVDIVVNRQSRARGAIRKSIEGLQVSVVDGTVAFCDRQFCMSGNEDELWYWDDDHLSVAGVGRLLMLTKLGEHLGVSSYSGLPSGG